MKLIESRNEPCEDLLCPSPWAPASVCVVFRGPGPDSCFFQVTFSLFKEWEDDNYCLCLKVFGLVGGGAGKLLGTGLAVSSSVVSGLCCWRYFLDPSSSKAQHACTRQHANTLKTQM